MINLFRKARPKKKNLLELPAAQQKKIYKDAANKSIEMQMEVVKKYESTFGERIEKGR
jgi:hypothetical protein